MVSLRFIATMLQEDAQVEAFDDSYGCFDSIVEVQNRGLSSRIPSLLLQGSHLRRAKITGLPFSAHARVGFNTREKDFITDKREGYS